jgi:hypothetical protein
MSQVSDAEQKEIVRTFTLCGGILSANYVIPISTVNIQVSKFILHSRSCKHRFQLISDPVPVVGFGICKDIIYCRMSSKYLKEPLKHLILGYYQALMFNGFIQKFYSFDELLLDSLKPENDNDFQLVHWYGLTKLMLYLDTITEEYLYMLLEEKKNQLQS